MVAAPSAGTVSFHADLRFMAQPRGALLRLAHRESFETRIAHEHCATPGGHPGVRRRAQRTRDALQMGQDRGRDPRQHATIRPSRAAGPWAMRPLILEITDPGD